MTATTVEDLFLADDLQAAGMLECADWVRTHSHELVEPERDGLYRGIGRWSNTSAATDAGRKRDLLLSDRLDAIGCGVIADELRHAGNHDHAALTTSGLRELLEAVRGSPEVMGEMLVLVIRFDDENFAEEQRQDEIRSEEAKTAGAEARAAGRIAASDIELLERCREKAPAWVVDALEGLFEPG